MRVSLAAEAAGWHQFHAVLCPAFGDAGKGKENEKSL